ncbi:MAG: hypothetical protein H7Z37_04825 [Pyrinomonadaceae bacterium]|nr:hypothetical protein [Pyrinomonadaceae bacterium]
MPLFELQSQPFFADCADSIESLYARCIEATPNYGVGVDCFNAHLAKGIKKYLNQPNQNAPTSIEVNEYLNNLQIQDLFLAIACANGNENAWWEFDQQHRSYLSRVAKHLSNSEANAEEVVDSVYVELYGTKIVDGARQSKFATYSGRGSLRGWLRTIVWHALVDQHRAGHNEVSLDEMTENVGEGHAQSTFLDKKHGGEDSLLDEIVQRRYAQIAQNALDEAFSTLDNHEKLLLIYYHVENLRLREIANLVQVPSSPLRSWFQRKSATREKTSDARVHESTVMRWLEKTYAKVLHQFHSELTKNAGLKETEIEICVEIASQNLAHGDITRRLSLT